MREEADPMWCIDPKLRIQMEFEFLNETLVAVRHIENKVDEILNRMKDKELREVDEI